LLNQTLTTHFLDIPSTSSLQVPPKAPCRDLCIYEVTNVMLEKYLKDEEQVSALMKKLKV
jgi:hypothetical protein